MIYVRTIRNYSARFVYIFTGYGGDQGGFLNTSSQFASPTKKEDKVSDKALRLLSRSVVSGMLHFGLLEFWPLASF
jgi:hypothetical protein